MSLLQVEGLGISFGGVTAVNDVSFALETGRILSVIGPNGAGKTTLFNMISGVYLPKSGRVRLDGEDVTGLRPDLLAVRGMSRTFQNLQIFHEMSVLENVIVGFHMHERGPVLADLFGLPGSRKRARAAAEGARVLLERVGLERAAEREAGALSYGALKRLEIARALAASPRVLLLDEPAEGLAPQIVAEVADAIAALKQAGLSILLVEHNLPLALRLADTCVVLSSGEVVWRGPPQVLADDPALMAQHLGVH